MAPRAKVWLTFCIIPFCLVTLSYSRKIFEDSFLQLWRQPWPISEHLRSKGAMETIRYMVLQLDPRQGPLPNILSVQDTELCHMLFGDIDLHNNVPVIFVSFSPWIVTEPRDEDRFAKTTVRIPYVTLSTFSVQLHKWKKSLFTWKSEVTNKASPTDNNNNSFIKSQWNTLNIHTAYI